MECIIYLLIYVIVAIIALYVLEQAVGSLVSLPPPVWHLIRITVALIVLLRSWSCISALVHGRGSLP